MWCLAVESLGTGKAQGLALWQIMFVCTVAWPWGVWGQVRRRVCQLHCIGADAVHGHWYWQVHYAGVGVG
jgi:hypothetical protein